ncbi:hypothetical protein CP09DC78_1263, partial [Chlamydia psittaci 09DC78]
MPQFGFERLKPVLTGSSHSRLGKTGFYRLK